MKRAAPARETCPACGKKCSPAELIPGISIRPGIVELIQADHPDWTPEEGLCREDLNRYRAAYVEKLLIEDRGELSSLDREVLNSLKDQELLAKDTEEEFEQKLTIGQRAADGIAEFGGSWRFIIIFFFILGGWITLNIVFLSAAPFDPYPFILLNLILSCLAAIQAPIIMMSQNRQETKDRLRSQHDYQVNLKAKLEIRHLHEKLDHLLESQWQHLLEIQDVQTALLEELTERRGK